MATNKPIKSTPPKPTVSGEPASSFFSANTQPFRVNVGFALIAALVGFGLYVNTIGHIYVLDDVGAITGNEYVMEGLSGIPKILKVGMWHFENLNLGYYRPVSMITFAIENEFFPSNPHISHLGNIVLYAVTGFFLCLLLMNVFCNSSPIYPFAITLLFMAHPIHTEVVANIKSRDEILSFLNQIIALLLLLTAQRQQANRQTTFRANQKLTFLACTFFYIALLSKESALTGLFIAPAILFFSFNITFKQALLKTVPFLLTILIFQIHKYVLLGTLTGEIPKDIVNYPYAETGEKMASTFLIFMHYIRLILFPHPLSYDYSYNMIPSSEFSSPMVLSGLLILAALVYISFKEINKKSHLALGVVIFCVSLIPALAFVFLHGGILAERFLYAPAWGFCILLVWVISQVPFFRTNSQKDQSFWSEKIVLLPSLHQGMRLGILLVIFSLYSFKTITRNTAWHDNLSLFSTDINTAFNSCQAQRHFGSTLLDVSVLEQDSLKKIELFNKGMEHLRISLRINPHFGQTYFKLGYVYQNLKSNTDSAIFYYNRAIEESPSDAMAFNNLGSVYNHLGVQELASYYFNKAVEVNPYFTPAIRNRDDHKRKTGLDIHQFPSKLPPEIIEKIAKNKDALFYFKLGTNLTLSGDYEKGARYLEKAIEMDPTHEDSYLNLSTCYGMLEKYNENIEVLNKLLKINPNNAKAYQLLAITYEITQDKEKAKLNTEMAKKLSGK